MIECILMITAILKKMMMLRNRRCRRGEEAEEIGEDQVDQHADLQSGNSGKEKLFEGNGNDIRAEPVENIEKPNASTSSVDNDKHAELLSFPPHGSQVFIGGLSRDVSEVELRDLCESIGETFEIRLMKNRDIGESNGFAFVAFKTKDVAQKAIEVLHDKEFKVRALYVKNIPENTSIEQLKELFQRHGEVTKVIMPPAKSGGKRDFGFVHYAERSSVLNAIKETEKILD